MYHIVFEYLHKDEWIRQECVAASLNEWKKIYGLNPNCDYRIISIKKV